MKILALDLPYHPLFDPLPDGVTLVTGPAADVELAVFGIHQRSLISSLIPDLPSLRIVQSLNSGVDWLLPSLPATIEVYNASGVHDAAVAEWIVAVLLSLRRRLPELHEAQQRGEWIANTTEATVSGLEPIGPIDTFEGGRVLIIGFGSIGRALATRLATFGIRVQGVARRARPDALTMDALPDLIPAADAVVLLVPLSEETEHLVNSTFLARMKRGAILINAARGRLVDTDALIEALRKRQLYAALDVTDPEPLPNDHPLWQAPNLLITPHVAGAVASWQARAYRFTREQLLRYISGQPLLNRVQ
ncbi:MAG: NAD(P)-dependent oxidoreductase [Planctomycetota bacterium]